MHESTSTEAREISLKFIYQCDTEKLYYFSDTHFSSFISFQAPTQAAKKMAKIISEGVLSKLDEIDRILNKFSKKMDGGEDACHGQSYLESGRI